MSTATCRIRLESDGLRGRTQAVMNRERERFEQAVEDVHGVDPDVHIDPIEPEMGPPLPVDVLLESLAGPTGDRRTAAAAFVAGRCTTDDVKLDDNIRDAVAALVSSIDRSERLGPNARTFVEAVMAIGLLGEPDKAIELFSAQLANAEFRSVADSRAAGYLAQFGDPAGYPVLLDDLHQTGSAQVRMQALEDLLAFAPYNGELVGEAVIDVNGELRRAINDDPSVAGQARHLATHLGLNLDEQTATPQRP
jgi:hypothetical protein